MRTIRPPVRITRNILLLGILICIWPLAALAAEPEAAATEAAATEAAATEAAATEAAATEAAATEA
ncbi:MAG: hypothetical protein AMJ69_02525, partial [Gammaproteobacteria bacterium SG8_47]